MAKKIVIVESPSKTKAIEKYLGKDFKVLSSKGHIRDLATKGKYGFGVDTENKFTPTYTTISGKKKVINELKKEVEGASHVYLATDPDREGEAISWHLYEALELDEGNYERIIFNEITKNAVLESFNNARKIDRDLVNSQETRRILDRIIGFRLSKLMQAKTDGTSAGRVQSVALKLVVDREREIESFNPEEYWNITAIFNDFKAELFNCNNKKLEIKTEVEANKIYDQLSNSFKIESVDKKGRNKQSRPPFITSTLQQEASNKLGMNSRRSMMVAQKLYEGIELADETVGLITYMRTDSIRLSSDFIAETFNHIKAKYGDKYVGSVKVPRGKKSTNVQDAHEAIRPTSIKRTPESVKPYLTDDEFKLYRIIYYRALASLMAPAKTDNTTVILDNNNYQFKATGQVITFDGYLKVYRDYEDTKDTELPDFDSYESNIILSKEIEKTQHFTKPPARYNEASLIKEMEELGIGRPSTYSSTVNTLSTRGYVNIVEKRFHPTDIGIEITDKLQEFFSELINVKYTANMEDDLDKVANGDVVWYEMLEEFYKIFEPAVQKAFDNMEKKELVYTGEDCPNCDSPLVVRKGRYGEFVACSNFPECKYIKPSADLETAPNCPNCDGKIVEKKTRRGKVFYGCNNYPNCKTAYWDKPTGELCSECNSMLVEKRDQIKCSNKECSRG